MARLTAPMLMLCGSIAFSRPLPGTTKVAVIAHFEGRPGPNLVNWIAPVVAEVFRPAGLSLEWYATRDAVSENAARVLDVWFHGDCRPGNARQPWRTAAEAVPLGWVLPAQGRLTGDIIVDCSRVMRFAAEARSPVIGGPLLEIVFLRLLERVIAHELLHVLLMSARHGASEFTSARMRVSDWQRIGRLTPAERHQLRRLYARQDLLVWEAIWRPVSPAPASAPRPGPRPRAP